MTDRAKTGQETPSADGERIARRLARAGLCSRREAERWIADGRVAVDGKVLTTPAVTVTAKSRIAVDGKPLPASEPAKLWRYHKPKGLVTTHRDPEGRATVFDRLPPDLPRVISIGRLDLNTEGLLLLTNDGDLARLLELPSTGWSRRYRVRVHGKPTQAELDTLAQGVTIEGVRYGAIQARLDSQKGDNAWLSLSLAEGKNREVRRVLEHLGLEVNRLIRVSYGPFQLGDLARGAVEQVPTRVLRDQLGAKGRGIDLSGPEKQARQQRKAQKPDKPAEASAAERPAARKAGQASAPAAKRPNGGNKRQHAHRRRQP